MKKKRELKHGYKYIQALSLSCIISLSRHTKHVESRSTKSNCTPYRNHVFTITTIHTIDQYFSYPK